MMTTLKVVRLIEEIYPVGGYLCEGHAFSWRGIVTLGRRTVRAEILAAFEVGGGIPGLPLRVRGAGPADGLKRGHVPSWDDMAADGPATDWYVHLLAEDVPDIAPALKDGGR